MQKIFKHVKNITFSKLNEKYFISFVSFTHRLYQLTVITKRSLNFKCQQDIFRMTKTLDFNK